MHSIKVNHKTKEPRRQQFWKAPILLNLRLSAHGSVVKDMKSPLMCTLYLIGAKGISISIRTRKLCTVQFHQWGTKVLSTYCFTNRPHPFIALSISEQQHYSWLLRVGPHFYIYAFNTQAVPAIKSSRAAGKFLSLFLNWAIMSNAIQSIAGTIHKGHERFSDISRGRQSSSMTFQRCCVHNRV